MQENEDAVRHGSTRVNNGHKSSHLLVADTFEAFKEAEKRVEKQLFS
jgi:hypothetical protein